MSDAERASETPEESDASQQDFEAEGMDDAALDQYLEETPEESDSEGDKEESGTVEEETSSPDGTGEGEEETSSEEETASQESELDKLRKQVETLSKQVSDKEDFIQNRNQEIGDLRKQLREEASKLRDEIPDLMAEDPVAGIDRMLRAREKEANIARMEADLKIQTVTRAHKAEVLKFCPGFEDRVDEIAEIAKSDGVPPEAIREFRNNPYATTPSLLKTLLRRADDAREIKTLKESLKKEKAGRESVAERIANAAAKTKVVSGKTPASASSEDVHGKVSEADLELLSDKDLDAFLEREG